jgi:hypothetical protein
MKNQDCHGVSERDDWIAECLAELYGCSDNKIWRLLLGTEYEHALQLLIEAKVRFSGAYSGWLALQDGFGNLATRKYFKFLKLKELNGHSRTVGNDGKLVDYGILLALGNPFDRVTQQRLLRFERSTNEEIYCLAHIHMTKKAEQKTSA